MGELGKNTRDHRILVFGWGAAAEAVLREIVACKGGRSVQVRCISHCSQAADCDLRHVCTSLNVECMLLDDDPEVYLAAKSFEPDLIISASYRKKLQPCVLELTSDCINFHPSLLPKHRGCWSGFWTIFEGDVETGVTCHRMVECFDMGRVLHQERLVVSPDDTSFSIYRKILPVTSACARHILGLYLSSGLPEGEEQTGPASYHYRRLPFDGLILPEWSDDRVERFIRAMHFPPFEGAAACFGGERVLVESLDHYRRLRGAAMTAVTSSTMLSGLNPVQTAVAAPGEVADG
mmetsp:Transcript_55139/g.139252  ORF Transcript_55139/g.139252 Transcript_55139/m.139252 type:complete len:292 (-) Transcript_55139:23-898(-)|eukprot:CAMPEP_0115380598 /NCGR_PEP_ID=MMETSP0271-20121206/5132_1 /TAXON_ID=71861 /ORGANISM="Scrippsiella trochoidea, Strain CCMP3099" /LENGTH=291 /DNA_ID=CAMNT_0002803841 /DNA_START=1 /DNA_END=876 /DNA_ORIENTATION=+